MALLDMVVNNKLLLQDQVLQRNNVIVAHFDHGIRDNSSNDAKLVAKLAAKYEIECVISHNRLGKNSSEQLARQKRYKFLRQVADDGKIITAHHQDDLLETIVMNLIRGTGWRGLAPFWSDDIERPLLGMSKVEIVNYAIEQGLDWAEDETNYSPRYFRNRVRDFTVCIPTKQRQKLLKLNQKQIELRSEIEEILENAVKNYKTRSCSVENVFSLPENVAVEVLRKITDERLTTPQLKRLLKNLKTAKSGDVLQPGGKIQAGVYRGELTISELS